jgi:hypothetical protein
MEAESPSFGRGKKCKDLDQQKIEIYEDKLLSLIVIRNLPTSDR